jgi:hypothetical protein
MSFQTEMEARYGTENLKQWTNYGPNTNITAVNTATLAAALVDVQGDFRRYAGVEYDETDNRMLGLACERAVFYLKKRGGAFGTMKDMDEETKGYLVELRAVTNANVIVPALVQNNSYPDRDTNRSFADWRTLERLGFPATIPSPIIPRE